MRSVDCSTDHRLLGSKVKRRPKGKNHPPTPQKSNLETRKINHPDITVALQNDLSKRQEQVAFTKGKTDNFWAKPTHRLRNLPKKLVNRKINNPGITVPSQTKSTEAAAFHEGQKVEKRSHRKSRETMPYM